MDMRDRLVVVRADALRDLCALAYEAADDIERRRGIDPLATSLRGAVAEVAVHSVLEPAS